MSREPLYSALFSTLQAALLAPAGPFETVSRRWQDPAQISPSDRPALFQVQKEELAATSINGLPLNWKLSLDLVIYSAGGSDSLTAPSTELNSLLDAVESAVRSITPGLVQSLGAKVTDCRIEGKIEIVENVQGSAALAVVPIEIITAE